MSTSYKPTPPVFQTISGVPHQLNNRGVAFAVSDITHPSPTDVLCGRGGGTNNNPGNIIYRGFIERQNPEVSGALCCVMRCVMRCVMCWLSLLRAYHLAPPPLLLSTPSPPRAASSGTPTTSSSKFVIRPPRGVSS